jgi:hypothetical protein
MHSRLFTETLAEAPHVALYAYTPFVPAAPGADIPLAEQLFQQTHADGYCQAALAHLEDATLNYFATLALSLENIHPLTRSDSPVNDYGNAISHWMSNASLALDILHFAQPFVARVGPNVPHFHAIQAQMRLLQARFFSDQYHENGIGIRAFPWRWHIQLAHNRETDTTDADNFDLSFPVFPTFPRRR